MSRAVSAFLRECVFKCPLCSIGEMNTLIGPVITRNQIFNESKHATQFNINAALLGEVVADIVVPAAVQQPDPVQPQDQPPPQQVQPQDQPVVTNDPANHVAAAAADDAAIVQPAPVNNATEPAPPVASQPAAAAQPAAPAQHAARNPTGRPPTPVAAQSGDVDPGKFPPSIANEGLRRLHDHDISRAVKLIYILNTLTRLPGHPNTLICGDSHLNHMDGKEVDPDDDQVRIRSVGGLCIPVLVFGLAQHKTSYKKIKRVIFTIGTNDALHSNQHHGDERPKYLRLLQRECARVFPSATVSIILPFTDTKGVATHFIQELEQDIKSYCPKFIIFRPPNMRKMFSKSGVHLNNSGRKVFVKYLNTKFVKPKPRPFSQDSGRRAGTHPDRATPPTYSRAHESAENFRVRPMDTGQHSASPGDANQALVQEIAHKVCELLGYQNFMHSQFPTLPSPLMSLWKPGGR